MPKIYAYVIPKEPDKLKDCKSAFDILESNKSLAVSYGISQSFFTKTWAGMLTKEYVSDLSFSLTEHRLVSDLRSRSEVPFITDVKLLESASLETLFNCENFGAVSFLGLRFAYSGMIKYELLGDLSIVITKNNRIKQIISYNEFDNMAVCSDCIYSSDRVGINGEVRKGFFILDKGIEAFVVTRGLANIIINAESFGDKGEYLIDRLSEISSHNEFEDYIDLLKKDNNINEEVSMIRISWSKSKNIELVDKTELTEYVSPVGNLPGRGKNSNSFIDKISKIFSK